MLGRETYRAAWSAPPRAGVPATSTPARPATSRSPPATPTPTTGATAASPEQLVQIAADALRPSQRSRLRLVSARTLNDAPCCVEAWPTEGNVAFSVVPTRQRPARGIDATLALERELYLASVLGPVRRQLVDDGEDLVCCPVHTREAEVYGTCPPPTGRLRVAGNPRCPRDGRSRTRTWDLFLISQERAPRACIRQRASAHENACIPRPTPDRSCQLADAGVGTSRDADVRGVCAVWWRIRAAGVGSRR